ncbi:hypothetical protein SNEBB_007479 [Seison nebaliae]|nr:hypothetical protein SNEBB_007479 [Seison nebaliae]
MLKNYSESINEIYDRNRVMLRKPKFIAKPIESNLFGLFSRAKRMNYSVLRYDDRSTCLLLRMENEMEKTNLNRNNNNNSNLDVSDSELASGDTVNEDEIDGTELTIDESIESVESCQISEERWMEIELYIKLMQRDKEMILKKMDNMNQLLMEVVEEMRTAKRLKKEDMDGKRSILVGWFFYVLKLFPILGRKTQSLQIKEN